MLAENNTPPASRKMAIHNNMVYLSAERSAERISLVFNKTNLQAIWYANYMLKGDRGAGGGEWVEDRDLFCWSLVGALSVIDLMFAHTLDTSECGIL